MFPSRLQETVTINAEEGEETSSLSCNCSFNKLQFDRFHLHSCKHETVRSRAPKTTLVTCIYPLKQNNLITLLSKGGKANR